MPNDSGLDIKVTSGVFGSGLYGSLDVMRGEEIQIFGAMQQLNVEQAVFCLPGTHSKWCQVSDGEIRSVTTYMTGEMYALIRQNSSVGRVIDADSFDELSFSTGMKAAWENPDLLNLLFSVRAAALLGKLEVACPASYLSGMLISRELDAANRQLNIDEPVVLIANQQLTDRYAIGFKNVGMRPQPLDGETTFLLGMKALVQDFEPAL